MFHTLISKLFSTETVQAHCDIPCGVYDPINAQIAAVSVARMMDTLADLEAHEEKDHAGKRGLAYQNTATRMVMEKEKSAETVKHEVRIIWGDFFKEPHISKFPEIHGLTHEIMQLGSKCKQGIDKGASLQLVEKVNRFAEIFFDAKGIKTKSVKYHCKPNCEIVVPEL